MTYNIRIIIIPTKADKLYRDIESTDHVVTGKMKALLIIFVASVVLVAAQVPERCETPRVWVAQLFRFVREESIIMRYHGRIAYDEENLRFRFLEGLTDQRGSLFAHYFFYKERLELRANFTTQQCERRYLNDTFRPFGISYDARYVDTLEIGSNIAADLGIEVYVWEGETESGGRYTSTYTTKGCLPVSDEYMRGTYYYSSHDFYDVEEGYNPDDFVPPDFCR